MCSERITKSRLIGCNDIQPGIQAVSFLPNVKGGLTLAADGRWEGTGMTGSIYRYDVDNESTTWSEDSATDNNTQTSNSTGTLTVQLPHLDRETRDQLNLLRMDRPHVFIELHNGNTLLIGAKRGANVSVNATSGAASTDLQGFTLTIGTRERNMYSYLGATGSTIYTNAINDTNAINPIG